MAITHARTQAFSDEGTYSHRCQSHPVPCFSASTLVWASLVFLSMFFNAVSADESESGGNAPVEATTVTDLTEVKEMLLRISDEYQKNGFYRHGYRISGSINPSECPFELVSQGGKYRFDMSPGVGSDAIVRNKVVRMFDGENYYAINVDGVGIRGPDDFPESWRTDIPAQVEQYFLVDFDGLKDVAECCDFLIRNIDGQRAAFQDLLENGHPFFTVYESDTNFVIELKGPEAEDGSGCIDHRRVELSRDFGCLPVQIQLIEMPSKGASHWKRTTTYRSIYRKDADGVPLLVSGEFTRVATGKNEETTTFSMQAEQVEVGEIEVGDELFDVDTIDIAPGSYVHDTRLTPPLEFTYEGGTLEEATLVAAAIRMNGLDEDSRNKRVPAKTTLEDRPEKPYPTGAMLGLGGAVLILVIGGVLFRKYFGNRTD
ncbi:MAG: hypothetical protein CMJ46_14355 [Planctomyces sp.]|nr:hypothetical protein [Planctomyces sp.]